MQALIRLSALAWVFFLFLSMPARAMSPAVVDAVVAPAWLERNGHVDPLGPGMEILHGDRIRTGAGSRAYLKLAEGSTVKLGENANLVFLSRSLTPQRLFKGALDIATGAFRFTTDLARRARGRDVSIRVGTATVGIRGTDVWGKSDDERDLVILIEGHVEVRHAGGTRVDLAEPLAAFVAAKGAPPLPVASVTADELRIRARETEIETGDGAARGKGRWILVLGRFTEEEAALRTYDAAHRAGHAARIEVRPAEAGWRYEVNLHGFADGDEAARAALRLKTVAKIEAVAQRR